MTGPPTSAPLGPPAAAAMVPPPPSSAPSRRRWLIVVPLAVVILGVIVVALTLGGGSSTNTAATTTTLSLAARTQSVADTLQADLCGQTGGGDCQVDGSSAGAISVHIVKNAVSQSRLQKGGTDTGLWSNADVERMLATRALDGTQRTADGKVSWTYHPDNGFRMVITIS